jgi:RNA polymerase sigma factor (sigma-70 family)
MEWTSQAVRGSAGAFARVYERHHRALYRCCRSLLGDDEEARDALQSTMTKALAALRFEERDFELRPWLFRIAHNEAVSRLRQRRDAVELSAVETLVTDSPAHAVELRERLTQLRGDLQDLPERQRAALVMRELSGLGHAEIAAVLGGSPRTVKQTIFDARVALNECAEGRGMSCEAVQRLLSDGDGRVRRGPRMRAHMRACRSCRDFEAALAERPAGLAVRRSPSVSRRRAPADRPSRHRGPAVRAPSAVAATPSTAVRARTASPAIAAKRAHPAHPAAPQPASRAHVPPQSASPPGHARSGHAKPAPPGLAKPAHAGGAAPGAAPAPVPPAAAAQGHGPPPSPDAPTARSSG